MGANNFDKYIEKIITNLEQHDPLFVQAMGKGKFSYILENKSCYSEKIARIFSALKSYGSHSKKYNYILAKTLLYAFSRQELIFISMNSHALTKNSDQLRDKPQYKKNKEVNKFVDLIQDAVGIKASYYSILHDLDVDFPMTECNELWQQNHEMLENISNVSSIRLSEVAGERYSQYEQEIVKETSYQNLVSEIEEFSSNISKLVDFTTSDDFVDKQMRAYSITGMVLEDLFPYAILLDVQKKRYPFEQPYYNFFRKESLPIVFCGQQTGCSELMI